MIGKLTGIIEEIGEDYIILDVNQVGYLVYLTSRELQGSIVGSTLHLFIQTYVREDNFQLFGFKGSAEKQCFIMLTSVSGVGPRLALALLNIFPAMELAVAITSNNIATLTQAPNVGKKLAERIILELKDKIGVGISAARTLAPELGEAAAVLTKLGIPYTQSIQLVSTVLSQESNLSLDQIIKKALQIKNHVSAVS